MPYNGFGTFTLPAGNPVVTGTTISSTINNNTNNDLANGLTNAITRNGQSPPTTNLPMGNFKLTGLTAGTTAGDSARYDELELKAPLTGTAPSLTVGGLNGTWTQMPAGTRMPFAQITAPTGWTQDTTDIATNRMLRVINTTTGVPGSSIGGGSDSPILNNTSIPAHTHTFTGTALAAHTHTDSGHAHGGVMRNVSYTGANYVLSGTYYSTPGSTDVAYAAISSVTAGTPAGTNANNTAVNWAPRYIDMIICSKN